ncbi:hypothetical protein CEXT_765251 [Caerostris extrusa]|uniref:C2H2-type domain-containing protein n=1 Tax=Caerostris extrusa TaxID=172846 RepID=A0AAV4M2Y4_CAEEX|nr:hypothetical protein CEXT_765251 [Caerostris extrusa]
MNGMAKSEIYAVPILAACIALNGMDLIENFLLSDESVEELMLNDISNDYSVLLGKNEFFSTVQSCEPPSFFPTSAFLPDTNSHIEEGNDNGKSVYKCGWDTCDKCFLCWKDLMHHINISHIHRDGSSLYQCHWNGCVLRGKTIKDRNIMLLHIRTHARQKHHGYEICGEKFSKPDNLQTHMKCNTRSPLSRKTSHLHNLQKDESFLYRCKWHGCDRQGESYNFRWRLIHHVQTHIYAKAYECEGCGKLYSTQNSLRKHFCHHADLLPSQALVMQVPMGIPPPNPMLMVQQQFLGDQNVPLVGGVPPLVQRNHPNLTSSLTSIKNAVGESTISSLAGDATPTEEDGTSVSSPGFIQKSVSSSVSSASVNSTPAFQFLGDQNVPLVGGVPPLVQRNHPNLTSSLTSIKNAVEESTISSLAGDATPTEEDGTSVSSPGFIQKSVSSSVSSASVNSTPAFQFGPLMNLHNSNRLHVPPPVSTSGSPTPYPSPHELDFNFPPPGMLPPNMSTNSQMLWMQKHCGSPFTKSASKQSRPGPGMPPHLFNSRLPFHGLPSQNSPMKNDNKDMGRRPGEMKSYVNRSPMHPYKMPQEMGICTDVESSMDRDYSHNEMKGPRFPGAIEFPPRMPMNRHRMRSSVGLMQRPHFPPGMHSQMFWMQKHCGSPFLLNLPQSSQDQIPVCHLICLISDLLFMDYLPKTLQ